MISIILFPLVLSGLTSAQASAASSAVSSLTVTVAQIQPTSFPVAALCPTAWTTIGKDLGPLFIQPDQQCSDLARAAVRFAFHDGAAFSNQLAPYPPASGGADGSLLLSPTEINRTENAGLGDYYTFLIGKWRNSYQSLGVGAADLVQFAGALGTVACPGGFISEFKVGRGDTSRDPYTGLLPAAFGKGSDHDTLYQLFEDKGFSAVDLAALIGAHTSAKTFFETQNGIPSGAPMDSTPGTWDVKYYNETYYPPEGVYRLEADINLSQPNTTVGKQFQTFVNNQLKWNVQFADAFKRLGYGGIPADDQAKFTDCTSIIYSSLGLGVVGSLV